MHTARHAPAIPCFVTCPVPCVDLSSAVCNSMLRIAVRSQMLAKARTSALLRNDLLPTLPHSDTFHCTSSGTDRIATCGKAQRHRLPQRLMKMVEKPQPAIDSTKSQHQRHVEETWRKSDNVCIESLLLKHIASAVASCEALETGLWIVSLASTVAWARWPLR